MARLNRYGVVVMGLRHIAIGGHASTTLPCHQLDLGPRFSFVNVEQWRELQVKIAFEI